MNPLVDPDRSLIDDPLPPGLENIPEVSAALQRVRLAAVKVAHEFPLLTQHEVMREARRRCAPAMVAAAEAMDARGRHQRPKRLQDERDTGKALSAAVGASTGD